MKYNIEILRGIRGFQALTQGEERIEKMLVENVNKTNKITGFNNTRIYVLVNEFDLNSLHMIIDTMDKIENLGGMSNLSKNIQMSLTMGIKDLLEKVIRDHVPADFVSTFIKGIKHRIEKLNGDVASAVDSIKKYMTCGKAMTITKIINDIEYEIDKGVVLYEPTEWV